MSNTKPPKVSTSQVETKTTQGMGCGLFAKNQICKDATIFAEQAFVVLQHTPNRRLATCCANCQGFIGGVATQMETIFSEPMFEETLMCATPAISQWNCEINCDKKDTPVRCECGEMYCSEKCRQEHWNHSHGLLCCAEIAKTCPNLEEAPLMKYKFHAIEHCDTLLLAATVYAHLILKSRITKMPLQAMCEEMMKYCHGAFIDACRPPQRGVKDHDFIDYTNGVVSEGFQMLKEHFLTSEFLLKGYKDQSEMEKDQGVQTLFGNEEFFSHVLGCFELNNIDVEILNPLGPFFAEKYKHIQNLSTLGNANQAIKEEAQTMENVMREKEVVMQVLWDEDMTGNYDVDSDEEEDAETMNESFENEDGTAAECTDGNCDNGMLIREEDYDPTAMFNDVRAKVAELTPDELFLEKQFPSFHGTGFYPHVARCNHSCHPNAKVFFDHNFNILQVKALRPIENGEQIFISYVEEEGPLDKRRKALKEYGFHCICTKCSAEEKCAPCK